MATNGKRSSISEKAKNVIMELFGALFKLVVIGLEKGLEINENEIAEWVECKDLDVYDEMELIAKNPIRIKVQEFLDNFGLVIDNIGTIGKIQSISVHGIYDQNIKIEAVLLCSVENGKIKLVGHKILKIVRMRKY